MAPALLDPPWLHVDLGARMQVLSWALNRPGFHETRRILWREVRNSDLPPGLDVQDWLDRELAAIGAADAVAMLTSRDVSRFVETSVTAGSVTAHCVATVGLSNAERIGVRQDRRGRDWGTINIALRLDAGLTRAAMLELLTIVAQARTTAVIEQGLQLEGGVATGTGTDCIAVAAPAGDGAYAGLHTELGEAAGAAVYHAVRDGARDWRAEQRAAGRLP